MQKSSSFGQRLSQAFQTAILIWLFGLVFFACGGFFLWLGGQVNTLICERVERRYINCTIETAWLGFLAMGETPVYGLQEAAVSANCDEDGCTYSIDLATEQGPVSLSPPAVSGREAPKRRTVDRINAFIDDPAVPTLRETHSEIGIQMVPVLIFMAVGLGIMGFGLLLFVNELRGRTLRPDVDQAELDEAVEEIASPSKPGKYGGMTGCQLSFTLVSLLLTAGLLAAAFSLAAPRIEGECVVQSRGWSEGVFYTTSHVDVSLATDPTVSGTIYHTHPTRAEAEAAMEAYRSGAIIPCGVNPWFTDQVTLTPGAMPAGHIFWGLVGLALVIGGFGLGNAISIIQTPAVPPGTHLPVRLQPEGGGATTQLWFLLPMLIALLVAIYAFFIVARQRFPNGDGYFWAGGVLLLLSLVAAGGIAYVAFEQLYLLYSGSQTIVELSARTLRAGHPAQLYIAYRPGRLTVEALELSLNCEQTTRENIRGSDGKSRYRYESERLYEQTLYETTNPDDLNRLGWAHTFDIDIPADARASTAIGRYPEIRWWLEVKMIVPKAPDFKLEYGLRVRQA